MKYPLLLSIFIISLISSIFIIQGFSCETACPIVQESGYGSLLGMQNGYTGIIIFSILILLTMWHILKPTKTKKYIIHTGTIIGSLIAIYFLYLQKFVIQEYCKYCLVVDFALIIAFIIILFNWEK